MNSILFSTTWFNCMRLYWNVILASCSDWVWAQQLLFWFGVKVRYQKMLGGWRLRGMSAVHCFSHRQQTSCQKRAWYSIQSNQSCSTTLSTQSIVVAYTSLCLRCLQRVRCQHSQSTFLLLWNIWPWKNVESEGMSCWTDNVCSENTHPLLRNRTMLSTSACLKWSGGAKKPWASHTCWRRTDFYFIFHLVTTTTNPVILLIHSNWLCGHVHVTPQHLPST